MPVFPGFLEIIRVVNKKNKRLPAKYNLSVSLSLDSSPSRGASGEEMRLSAMPKPPLGRGGGTAKP